MKTLTEITTYLKNGSLRNWTETFTGFERISEDGFVIRVSFYEEHGYLKAKFNYKHKNGGYLTGAVYLGIQLKPVCFEISLLNDKQSIKQWLDNVAKVLNRSFGVVSKAYAEDKTRLAELEKEKLIRIENDRKIEEFVDQQFKGFIADFYYHSEGFEEDGWYRNLDETVWIKPSIQQGEVVIFKVVLKGSAANNF